MPAPHIYRPLGPERLRLWMPYGDGTNRRWLHEALGARIQPVWDKPSQRWLIARGHFIVLVEELLDRFGVVDVSVEFSTTEQCDRRCQRAKGYDCQCSCLGEHHGGGMWGGWVQVGETTLVLPGRLVRRMRLTAH